MNPKWNMKSLPESEQPDRKAERSGIASLSDAELLSVIIRSGSSEYSVLQTSYEVLRTINGIGGLPGICPEQLRDIKGIGRVKMLQLAAIGELSARIWKEQREQELICSDSSSIFRYYREHMRFRQQEEVWILLLDNRLRRIRETDVSKGSVNCAPASPRDIFRIALENRAVCFVLMHNHPSGDPAPSSQDRTITDNVIALGKMLELPMIDHIIFGNNSYYSFRDANPGLF
ncbi:MAG: DNA repair protein RadC [Lachnospiraceae bacterium]|nr:DNA repair protein RadC [Lachnospiraceae bacterium]